MVEVWYTNIRDLMHIILHILDYVLTMLFYQVRKTGFHTLKYEQDISITITYCYTPLNGQHLAYLVSQNKQL